MPNITYTLSRLRDRITGRSELLIALTYGNGNRLRGKSNIFINPDRWDTKEQRLIIPRAASTERQELLQQQRQIIDLSEFVGEEYLRTDKDTVSKEWFAVVIDKFHFPEKYNNIANDRNIDEAFIEYINTSKMSDHRRKNTHVVRRIFQRFQLFNNEQQLTFADLSAEVIEDFEQFCRDEHLYAQTASYATIMDAVPESRKVSERGENSIIEIIRRFRTFIRWALERGLLQADPFVNYKIGQPVYGTPYYITLEERDRIANCDLSARPALAVQRDIFIFQCCIGCRVGDFMQMTKNDVINGAIEYIPHKTIDRRGRVVRVPLNSIARAIYNRYSDRDDDRLLPFISEQKYNDAIKDIFRIAGVVRPVTVINPRTGKEEKRPICDVASSHLARRTFVGNLYKQAKDLNLVCSLSGHVPGSKAVARYYEVDEEMRRDLVAMLE